MEYDENKAVEFINSRLAQKGRSAYPDDELLNVIDMIWDFYEENGLLDVDADDDDADDEDYTDDIITYVNRMLRKDKEARVIPDDVPLIVEAEMDYEDTIE